jgi:hypothetical protein
LKERDVTRMLCYVVEPPGVEAEWPPLVAVLDLTPETACALIALKIAFERTKERLSGLEALEVRMPWDPTIYFPTELEDEDGCREDRDCWHELHPDEDEAREVDPWASGFRTFVTEDGVYWTFYAAEDRAVQRRTGVLPWR